MWGSAFRHNNRGCGLQKLQVPSIWIVWRLDTPNSNGKLAIGGYTPVSDMMFMLHPHVGSWTVGGLASLRNVGSKQALKPPASWCRKIYFHLYYMHLCVFLLIFQLDARYIMVSSHWSHVMFQHLDVPGARWTSLCPLVRVSWVLPGSLPGTLETFLESLMTWMAWMTWGYPRDFGNLQYFPFWRKESYHDGRWWEMMGDDGRWWEKEHEHLDDRRQKNIFWA